MIIVIIILIGAYFIVKNNNTTTNQTNNNTENKQAQKLNELTDPNSFFNRALKHVFNAEGGYVNNPKDPGGATNMGITQATYDSWNRSKGRTLKHTRDITRKEATDIYYNWYWKPLNLHNASNYNMALVLFDTAVNHGVGVAGNILNKTGYSIKAYLEERLRRYKQDRNYNVFGQGWKNRLAHLNIITGAGALIV